MSILFHWFRHQIDQSYYLKKHILLHLYSPSSRDIDHVYLFVSVQWEVPFLRPNTSLCAWEANIANGMHDFYSARKQTNILQDGEGGGSFDGTTDQESWSLSDFPAQPRRPSEAKNSRVARTIQAWTS